MANLNLKPIVLRKMNEFTTECQKQGCKLLITQGLRTIEEQDTLYAQGRSKPGAIITNAKGGESMHNYGCAFDIAFAANKGITYNGNWDKIAGIAKNIGLEAGYYWTKFKDAPHFQYTAGYSLKDFQANKIDSNKFA